MYLTVFQTENNQTIKETIYVTCDEDVIEDVRRRLLGGIGVVLPTLTYHIQHRDGKDGIEIESTSYLEVPSLPVFDNPKFKIQMTNEIMKYVKWKLNRTI